MQMFPFIFFSFLFFSDFFVFTVKLMCKCFYFQTNLIFDDALDCQFYNDFTVRNENAIVEVIILLDFTHSWNDAWVEKDEKKWYIALLLVSVACYFLAFTFSEILFIWFNPYDSRFFFCSSCTASNGKGNIMFLVNDAIFNFRFLCI